MPWPVRGSITARQAALSAGVGPQASAGSSDWGATAGRLEKGWVAAVTSPGTSLWGTGRSVTGKTGRPSARPST